MGYTIYRKSDALIKGVLFDMDGVILDTERLYAQFWMEACHALGYPMTYEQALGMRSLSPQAGQAKLESYFGPGISREAVRNKRVALMDACIDSHGVEPKPGIFELLDYLEQAKLPAVVTTSSPSERARKYLEPLGLWHRFQRICTAYEVAKGKPEPDIYLFGAQALGLPPESCLAVEDSPAGIEAACRAGCMAVLVPDLDRADEAMKEIIYAQADSLKDLIDLIERMGG